MKPLTDFSPVTARNLRGVFTDIDDTLTSDGYLPAISYAAMERLQEAGMIVVPITGRPAGWCDLVARLWPVNGVVGENGAFYFHYDRKKKKMYRHYADDTDTKQRNHDRLMRLADMVISEVPGAAISADQAYRETDLAVDFREDVSPLDENDVQKIVTLLKSEGATVKVSSIHVNAWFGDYDKLTMTKCFARDILDLNIDEHEEKFVFTGDSPNDAPMFRFFTNSIGVANIKAFTDQIEVLPNYITSGFGGQGFAEVADFLDASRKAGA